MRRRRRNDSRPSLRGRSVVRSRSLTRGSETEDRSTGLWIAAQLDLSNDRAVKAYERLLAGTLDSLSVGFFYLVTHEEGDVTVIDKARLVEVSLTPVPSNLQARVQRVKSHPTRNPYPAWPKPGRSNPANDPSRVLDRLAAIEAKNRRPKRDDALVDGFVTRVRVELVEEAIAKARADAFDREMTERAHRISPIPEQMVEVTEGAVSVDEPEVIQVLRDTTEDEVYRASGSSRSLRWWINERPPNAS